MVKSAGSGRDSRRHSTQRRISRSAQQLAAAHGLDGFTMDDLAAAAEVSRRTLFNYFPGKDAAVLGSSPELDPAAAETFRAGGPTGHLVDDLMVIVATVAEDEDLSREEVRTVHDLMAAEPRLFAAARDQFEEMVQGLLGLIESREGPAYDEERARVVVRVLAALFDLALTDYVTRPDRDLMDLFAATLDKARAAFA